LYVIEIGETLLIGRLPGGHLGAVLVAPPVLRSDGTTFLGGKSHAREPRAV
jgi:hypothetical protein